MSDKNIGSGLNSHSTALADSPTLSIAVPVYNNAASLSRLNERLMESLDATGLEYEIIYINDGSTDNSYEILVELHTGTKAVKILDLVENHGQSRAILAGLRHAAGGIVVTIDADLQNQPEDIPALVLAIRNGADFACGVRLRRRDTSFARRLSSRLANWIVGHALGIRLQDWGCGLNAVTSDLAEKILSQKPLPALPKAEAAMLASRIEQIDIGHSERVHGHSQYTAWRLLRFALGFLRGYAIRQSFVLLLNRLMRSPDTQVSGSTTKPLKKTALLGASTAAILAWLILAGVAFIVQLGALLYPSAVGESQFKVREFLN